MASVFRDDDAVAWLNRAISAYERGDLEAAQRSAARGQRLDPDNPHLALVAARIALDEGRADAIELHRRARRLRPDDTRIILGEAGALFQAGRGREAVSLLRSAVERSPGWIEGLRTIARLRWQLGDGVRCLDDLKALLARRPGDTLLWAVHAGAAARTMGHEAVLTIIESARRRVGRQPILDVLEAEALTELGRLIEADHAFKRVPASREIPVELIRIRHMLRSGRPEEAARLAERLLEQPGDAAVWPYLGTAWRMLDDARWGWLDDERLVAAVDLEWEAGSLADLAVVLRRLHTSAVHPYEQSLRGGTQTDGPLLARREPVLVHLRKVLTAAANRHAIALPHDPRHPMLRQCPSQVRITGSWSVRLQDAGHHVSHVHTHGWLSSAFYVSLPRSMAGSESKEGWLALGAPPAELGLGLGPVRHVEPRPGRLVLFPSIMWHGTLPFPAGERLTVAFDAVPV